MHPVTKVEPRPVLTEALGVPAPAGTRGAIETACRGSGISVAEYVLRAIVAQLVRDGIDVPLELASLRCTS